MLLERLVEDAYALDNRQVAFRITNIAVVGVAALFVVLRYLARWRQGSQAGPDDYVITAALVLLLGNLATSMLMMHCGLGLHAPALSKEVLKRISEVLTGLWVPNSSIITFLGTIRVRGHLSSHWPVDEDLSPTTISSTFSTPTNEKRFLDNSMLHRDLDDLHGALILAAMPTYLQILGSVCHWSLPQYQNRLYCLRHTKYLNRYRYFDCTHQPNLAAEDLFRTKAAGVFHLSAGKLVSLPFVNRTNGIDKLDSVIFTSIYRFITLLRINPDDLPWTAIVACTWCIVESSAGIISACLPTLAPLVRRINFHPWRPRIAMTATNPKESSQLTIGSKRYSHRISADELAMRRESVVTGMESVPKVDPKYIMHCIDLERGPIEEVELYQPISHMEEIDVSEGFGLGVRR
ncbi:hypothetical protein BP6252_02757 [Coleophoma cylindrospora]|uniref:Rhodopsin domain-containing protein n=1 Tax=Coleophoma cylindrospora TaxID=1849047 RepID=A0A3D8SFP8_9HELO|nr:hypothetical protein BP6252_02757 [Coleophoma cylindrospora]